MKIPKFQEIIIHEDDDLIIINKPPFLSSLDERGKEEINLLRLAKSYQEDIQICHRLDKETSGVMILAKNPEAYRHISMQFEHRKVKKIYHAIVDGTHIFNDRFVDFPILQAGKGNVVISKSEGKRAETWFNSVEFFKHYTLIEAKPVTGRMHQIRIHLATQKASITGDNMYGGKPAFLSKIKRGYRLTDEEEQPIMKRFALHAKQVSFTDIRNEEVTYEADYPKDFAVLLKLLRQNDK